MHSIQRQLVEITTGSEAEAHEIGTRLQAEWRSGLPALEQALDRMSDGDSIRIDRIELDLGTLGGADWLDLFFLRLAAAFERSLGQGGAGGGAAAEDDGFAVIAAEGVARSSRVGSRFEALIQFLRRGRLPWWSDVETGRGWLARVVAGLSPEARQGLGRIAAVEPAVLARLVRAMPAETVAELTTDLVPPDLRGALAAFAEALAATVAAPAARWRLREAIWQAALMETAAAPAGEAQARLARGWVAALEAAAPGGGAARVASNDPDFAACLPEPWRQAFRAALAARSGAPGIGAHRRLHTPGFEGVAKADSADKPSDAANGPGAPPEAQQNPLTRARGAVHGSPERGPAPPGSELDETVPVTGAGSVLLHPFLPELFTRAGFWAEGAFVSPEARHLAVRLLGYLTFGDAEAEEAELLLARTICALDWEEPLLPDPPEAEALAAADALLASVLKHWTALRSSSPDWLREQFFRRDGHLKPNDVGLTLKVETRAQDVLLGRLPWGYGVVMLPWLAAPITVQWRD